MMHRLVTGVSVCAALTSCWISSSQPGLVRASPIEPALAADRKASSSSTDSPGAESPGVNTRRTDTPVTRVPTRYRRRYAGPITDGPLNEISGMAASQRNDQLLWVINDSGHSSTLFAIDTRGNLLASFATSVENRDWESMTSLTLDQRPYLLVGDSGDNLGIHNNYRLHLFEEPVPGADNSQPLEPVATTTFNYSDGKHNSEALAWSKQDNTVMLITKQAEGAGVYATPLALTADNTIEFSAGYVGPLARPPQSVTDALISNLAGVEMSQVTGLEIDSAGRHAYVLTYRGIYQYPREALPKKNPDDAEVWEDWSKTFARSPRLLSRHTLSQAEALALVPNTGTLFYTSEKLPAPLWRLIPVR